MRPLPHEHKQAARYVALSGEVLAEIQPDPGAWSRLLKRVREFEQSAGIDPAQESGSRHGSHPETAADPGLGYR